MSQDGESGKEERRRAPRHAVEGVAGTLRLLSKAQVLNVSVTGMAARTSTHLRVGQTCDVRLEHGGKTLRLPGKVVRAHLVSFGKTSRGETAPVYEIGFEFQGMLSEQAQALLALIGETAIISPRHRVAGRFTLREGAPANLDASADLLVHKISTSGLLVETEVRPESDQELELRLEIGTVPLTCRGRVAYVEPTTAGDKGSLVEGGADDATFLVGVEFLDLDPDERARLEAFIGEHLE